MLLLLSSNNYLLGSLVFFSSGLVFVVDVSVVVVFVAGLPVVVPEGRVAGLDVSGLLLELGLLVSVGRVAGLPVVVVPGLFVSVGRVGSGLTVGVVGLPGCGLSG